jgi:hypothetical protein
LFAVYFWANFAQGHISVHWNGSDSSSAWQTATLTAFNYIIFTNVEKIILGNNFLKGKKIEFSRIFYFSKNENFKIN